MILVVFRIIRLLFIVSSRFVTEDVIFRFRVHGLLQNFRWAAVLRIEFFAVVSGHKMLVDVASICARDIRIICTTVDGGF